MSYYQRHIFFCVNDRGEGADRPSCNQCGSARMRDYAKKKVKALGLSGPGLVRVNQAGCLDRCEEGPACVVYPEGVWYTYVDEHDVDEIIESHLVNGKPVERLMI
jgi:(2Fe-2S) ferredoxin